MRLGSTVAFEDTVLKVAHTVAEEVLKLCATAAKAEASDSESVSALESSLEWFKFTGDFFRRVGSVRNLPAIAKLALNKMEETKPLARANLSNLELGAFLAKFDATSIKNARGSRGNRQQGHGCFDFVQL